MLIGFDGSRAFVKNRTGTENYSYQLLVNLAKIDKENNYIIYLRPGNEQVLSYGNKIEGEWPDNFQFKVLAPEGRACYFKFFWTQFWLALQTFKDPLDILFTPAHTLPLVRKPGLKTVMTVHDLGAEYLPGMHQLKQRLYLGFITKFQLKTATKLIAVSYATKEDLIKKVGVDKNKIEVIYEGLVQNAECRVQSSELKNNETDIQVDLKKQFDIDHGRYFLFVGTVQPRKNLARLIEAFGGLLRGPGGRQPHSTSSSKTAGVPVGPSSLSPLATPELKLVIVGGKGWLSDEIYASPKRLGIEGQVKFLGRVDDKYLPSLYKNALGFTYPSLFEGFGLPILEAFYYNCPVLTSNISSMPEVAGSAAILVDPYDIDSIKNGMQKLLDVKQREKLVKLGKEQLKKFSWEKAARETLELFKQLI